MRNRESVRDGECRTYILEDFLGELGGVRAQHLSHFAHVKGDHVQTEGGTLLFFGVGLRHE